MPRRRNPSRDVHQISNVLIKMDNQGRYASDYKKRFEYRGDSSEERSAAGVMSHLAR